MNENRELCPGDIEPGPALYEGKAKKVFAAGREDLVVIHYKDDATAFNGEKKGQIADKGVLNNKIAAFLFELLEKAGVPTHFVARTSDRDMVCKKVKIIPLEVILRNVAAGSMAKRLGLAEGTALKTTVFELSYKDDALGDPLVNEYHAVAIGVSTFEEIEEIKALSFRVNRVLSEFFLSRGIRLIDFKLEFGRTVGGPSPEQLVLADEISPDTCRFWDAETNEKLDKDRFRRDLGNVREAYAEIFKRLDASRLPG
ncbi:MAG: phosphoribosylaminoimidazolesuccinocarboxamide synthase [Spirochaetaceae bacterium]|jgi:phosphoribosylaminoimidazole-succinocarboxamide synthase|nr:phosphoribosylaminoimidazolesuccinocarboxamide synthase [Spirochaetaceae bacterium]